MELRPIFVGLLPDFDTIKAGELWISHKYRTVNLRCPCGCDNLTVLSLHPSRWHVRFDGQSVSLDGPTGGSVWANSGCGSHYFIRNNVVVWANRINPDRHPEYADKSISDFLSITETDCLGATGLNIYAELYVANYSVREKTLFQRIVPTCDP